MAFWNKNTNLSDKSQFDTGQITQSKVIAVNEHINNQNRPDIAVFCGEYADTRKIVKMSPLGIKIFDLMLEDATVKAALQDRIIGVISRETQIEPASEDPRDIMIAEWITELFESINLSNFEHHLLQRAMASGFAVGVPNWNLQTYQLTDVQVLDSDRFAFRLDGNLSCKTVKNPFVGEIIDPSSVLIIRYGYDAYGESQLASAYWAWHFKKEFIKDYAIYGEKFASPTLIAKLREGQPLTQADINNLIKDLVAINSNSVALEPTNIDRLYLLEAQRQAVGDFYLNAIKFFNEEIIKAISTQTASIQGTPGKLGEEDSIRTDVRNDLIEGDAKLLCAAINHLIKMLVDVQFGANKYPKYRKVKPESPDTEQRLKIYDLSFKNKVPISLEQFRHDFNLNVPTDEDDKFVSEGAPLSQISAFSQTTKLAQKTPKEVAYRTKIFKIATEQEQAQTDFAKKQSDLMIRKYYRPIAEKLINSLKTSKNSKPEMSEDDFKNLQNAQANILISNYLFGRASIKKRATDIALKRFANNIHPIEVLMASMAGDEWIDLHPEQAIKFLSQFDPLIGKLESDVVLRAFKNGSTMAIADRLYIQDKIQQALTRALEQGVGLNEWIADSEGILSKIGLTIDNPFYAETIYRTNMNAAFNAGYQEDIMSSPFTQAVFPAYMYSAVMDDRTDPVDAAYDGLTAFIDDPIWNAITPPNHNNCRCQLVAIDKYAIEDGSVSVPKTAEFPTIQNKDGQFVPAMPPVDFQRNFAKEF